MLLFLFLIFVETADYFARLLIIVAGLLIMLAGLWLISLII